MSIVVATAAQAAHNFENQPLVDSNQDIQEEQVAELEIMDENEMDPSELQTPKAGPAACSHSPPKFFLCSDPERLTSTR